MPLELPLEKQRFQAASFLDQVLALVVRIDEDTSLCLSFVETLEKIYQVDFLFHLLVFRKIFKVTYCFRNPSIKVIGIFHQQLRIVLSIGQTVFWVKAAYIHQKKLF